MVAHFRLDLIALVDSTALAMPCHTVAPAGLLRGIHRNDTDARSGWRQEC